MRNLKLIFKYQKRFDQLLIRTLQQLLQDQFILLSTQQEEFRSEKFIKNANIFMKNIHFFSEDRVVLQGFIGGNGENNYFSWEKNKLLGKKNEKSAFSCLIFIFIPKCVIKVKLISNLVRGWGGGGGGYCKTGFHLFSFYLISLVTCFV